MKKESNLIFLIVIFLFIGLFTKIVKNAELKGGYINHEKFRELEDIELNTWNFYGFL